MLFNSFEYLIFFPVVTAMYFLLPHRFRWGMLLFASCVFYMFFKPEYILILAFTIVVDYYAGIFIASSQDQVKRKRFLLYSLVANISVLALFKYYNFFNLNIRSLGSYLGYNLNFPLLTILLPIGLSFHTFQAMSYTLEVYRGNQQPERHFGIYALYVMFFPQLVAGPIERPQNLLHQFYERHSFDVNRVISGLKLISWGLFKKLVIADRLSPLVDQVYNHPQDAYGGKIILATFFFAEQIYCDFSGYSDIAIGSARVLGFKLMKNFRNPYSSQSISEFWSRWHISLSTWFRDYLYIPLGGNRVSTPRWMMNLFITFLVSGLWHGANWTFIIWGFLNGLFILSEIVLKRNLKVASRIQLPGYVKCASIFILISFTWLFFRANNLGDAKLLLSHIFGVNNPSDFFQFNGFDAAYVQIALFFIVVLEVVQYLNEKRHLINIINGWPYLVRMAMYALFITVLLNFGIFNKSQFIYFQF